MGVHGAGIPQAQRAADPARGAGITPEGAAATARSGVTLGPLRMFLKPLGGTLVSSLRRCRSAQRSGCRWHSPTGAGSGADGGRATMSAPLSGQPTGPSRVWYCGGRRRGGLGCLAGSWHLLRDPILQSAGRGVPAGSGPRAGLVCASMSQAAAGLLRGVGRADQQVAILSLAVGPSLTPLLVALRLTIPATLVPFLGSGPGGGGRDPPQPGSRSAAHAGALGAASHTGGVVPPDPSRRHELRCWDGQRWTQRVADRGIQGVDPL